MIKRKLKKGELTTQQIVLLIVLITSFIVILFLLFRLNLGKVSDDEVCHNSVVMRGSAIVPTGSIPLNCKTSYVCLTEDGSCEEMIKPEIKKVKTKEDVYRVLADEMVDCWWMFGEGKINYTDKDFVESKLYCSICSQVAFDDSLEDIFEGKSFNQSDLYQFIGRNNMSGKEISYSEYLFDFKDVKSFENNYLNKNFGNIGFEKQYFVVMGTFSEISNLGYITLGAVAGAGTALAFLSAPASVPILGFIAVSGIGGTLGGYAGSIIATIVRGYSGGSYFPPIIIEANSKDFNSLKCEEIETLS